MDTLYPRLLVDEFTPSFHFYREALRDLFGADVARGDAAGPYASWDVDGQAVLALLDRRAMTGLLGPGPAAVDTPTALAATTGSGRPAAPADGPAGTAGRGADTAALVLRVSNVAEAAERCRAYGGRVVAPAAYRPEWGPNLRTAHLRDPAGNLLELQSY